MGCLCIPAEKPLKYAYLFSLISLFKYINKQDIFEQSLCLLIGKFYISQCLKNSIFS